MIQQNGQQVASWVINDGQIYKILLQESRKYTTKCNPYLVFPNLTDVIPLGQTKGHLHTDRETNYSVLFIWLIVHINIYHKPDPK